MSTKPYLHAKNQNKLISKSYENSVTDGPADTAEFIGSFGIEARETEGGGEGGVQINQAIDNTCSCNESQ